MSSPDSADAPRLHLPPNQRYDCVMCGRGCSDFWEIPVDPASEERLAKYDLKPHQQRLRDEPPFVPSEFDARDRALCREHDVCTFLTEDKKCALHAALGPREKPQTCIDFPFRYVDTPQGTFIGLTFACTAVLEQAGREVEAHREDLVHNHGLSVHRKETAERPLLTARVPIDFEAYLALEGVLDELLAMPRFPLSDRLLAQSVFVDLLVRLFEASRFREGAELPEEDRGALATLTDLQTVEALAQQYRRDNWGTLMLLARKAKPSAPLQRAFIGLVITFRQALWRRSSRPRALAYIGHRYLMNALRLGRVHLQPLKKRFSYREFSRRKVDAAPGSYYDELLTRYFRHVLFRKDLLLAETVRSGQRFALMHFALINWYLVGLMVERDEQAPDDDTVREALRSVEKYYVHHSTYTRFLEEQPLLGTFVDSVIGTTRYAPSMVRWPA